MAKPRKAWTFNPGKKPKAALPGTLKDEVDTKAKELRVRGIGSFADWRKLGFDEHSLLADPLFMDAAKGDYRLHPESPAFRLGFRPIELARIGLLR